LANSVATIYITADALTPADHAIEAAYAFGGGPTYDPVAIDGATQGNEAANRGAAVFTNFGFGGNLYAWLNNPHAAPLSSFVSKSTDHGVTWAKLDGASSPPYEIGRAYFDASTSSLICCFITSNVGAVAPLVFQDFSLLTETWGAAYGVAGAPSGKQITAVYKRPDDTLLVIYQDRSGFGAAEGSGVQCAIYDIGAHAWVTDFDAGANIIAQTGWDSTQTLCTALNTRTYMDAAGNVGVFPNTSSLQTVPVIWINRYFYQRILLDNSLGSFFDFPGQVQPLTPAPPFGFGAQDLVAFSGSAIGRPALLPSQDIIAVPCLTTNRNGVGPRQLACLYIGTPISAPVWTVDYAKSIDPESLIDDSIYPEELGDTIFDGTTLYVTFSAQGADFSTDFERVRLCQTANLASPADGWTAATIFSLSVDSPPGFNFAGQELRTVAAFIPSSASPVGIDCDSPPAGQVGVAYSHTFPATGGTAPYTFAVTAGALPDGVTLDPATGIAAGTPTLAGLFSFTIEVTDADANTAHVDCSILIGLSIVCGNPPAGRVGVPYSHTFPATGGTAPYTFAITAGALLNGLTLDPDTGAVSGTPSIPGTGITTFTIQVTDAVAATASVACSIAVLPAALKITLRGVRRVAKAECEPEAERTDAPEATPRKGRVL
jgi:hypothetical protein